MLGQCAGHGTDVECFNNGNGPLHEKEPFSLQCQVENGRETCQLKGDRVLDSADLIFYTYFWNDVIGIGLATQRISSMQRPCAKKLKHTL